jgi:GTP-binding protein EngB required for normal cell division
MGSASSDEYIRHLQVLQDIRDKCGGKLHLPQICVVGDQSSGKSSALACITGITFPVKSGICTKAPIVVECRRDQTLGQPVFEIQDQASKSYRRVDLRALASEIEKIQNKFLDANGRSGSIPERPKISQDEIRVKVCGPEQIDLVVVDLPGIINAGDGQEDTHNLICQYIKDQHTLILLVSEAKQDKELTGALDLANKFDPTCHRTLRLLTKFDTFDSPDAKATAVGLIKEQLSSKLGAHALVCRSAGGDYDTKEESKVLSAAEVPEKRAGVDTLKDRLPSVYAELMRTSLPGLKKKAQDELRDAKKSLETMGQPIDKITMILHCQSVLNRSLFEEQVTPSMRVFQEAVHNTEEEHYTGVGEREAERERLHLPILPR